MELTQVLIVDTGDFLKFLPVGNNTSVNYSLNGRIDAPVIDTIGKTKISVLDNFHHVITWYNNCKKLH